MSILILLLSVFTSGTSVEPAPSHTTTFLCTCQEALTGKSADQYVYLVKGHSAKACKEAEALTDFPGFHERRVANEGRTWTIEDRREVPALQAQRAGLELEGLQVTAADGGKFPMVVQEYYPNWR